jgi:hypothetical protein
MSILLMSIATASKGPVSSAFAPQAVYRNSPALWGALRRPSLTLTQHFSSPPSQQQPPEAKTKSQKLRNTGGLRKLPVVKAPKELMDKARKAPKRVKNDP